MMRCGIFIAITTTLVAAGYAAPVAEAARLMDYCGIMPKGMYFTILCLSK